MYQEFSINSLIIISLITIVTLGIYILMVKSSTYKLIAIGITYGVYIYSGIGIGLESVDDKYIFMYSIYLWSILFPIYISYKLKINNRISNYNTNKFDIFVEKNIKIFIASSILFFIFMIVYLITPVFRLDIIINPPSSSAYNQVKYNRLFSKSKILYYVGLVKTLLLPMFLVYLNYLIKQKKKKNVVMLILLWIYLEFLKLEYISRSEIIVFLMFIILTINIIKREVILNKKDIFRIIILGILSLPLLVLYENSRLGISNNGIDIVNSISQMISNETSYPVYYDHIISNKSEYTIKTYMIWLFTLPIPKSLISLDIPTINATFTNMMNESLGYIILPSILGEAMMVFGKELFWLHGIIIGTIISIVFKIIRRTELLTVTGCYIIVMLFSLGRGGSTQIISFCINGLIGLWIFKFGIKFLKHTSNS